MTKKWHLYDTGTIANLYTAGTSVNALAKQFSTTRDIINTILKKTNTPVRNQIESNRLMMSKRTPEEHARNTHNSHLAAKLHVHTFEEKVKRANTRMKKQVGTSSNELLLSKWLEELGMEATPQFAIGPYNCDLAVENTAIEIYGGSWHQSGRHASRSFERFKYLFDNGWNVIIIWLDNRSFPLRSDCVDEIVNFNNDSSETKRYMVMWGTGQKMAVGIDDPNEPTFIKSRRLHLF